MGSAGMFSVALEQGWNPLQFQRPITSLSLLLTSSGVFRDPHVSPGAGFRLTSAGKTLEPQMANRAVVVTESVGMEVVGTGMELAGSCCSLQLGTEAPLDVCVLLACLHHGAGRAVCLLQ